MSLSKLKVLLKNNVRLTFNPFTQRISVHVIFSGYSYSDFLSLELGSTTNACPSETSIRYGVGKGA